MFRDWKGKAIRIYVSTRFISNKRLLVELIPMGNTEDHASILLPIQWKQGHPHKIVNKDLLISEEEHNKQVEDDNKRQLKKMEREERKNERRGKSPTGKSKSIRGIPDGNNKKADRKGDSTKNKNSR